jgi:hypothetical protein
MPCPFAGPDVPVRYAGKLIGKSGVARHAPAAHHRAGHEGIGLRCAGH